MLEFPSDFCTLIHGEIEAEKINFDDLMRAVVKVKPEKKTKSAKRKK